MVHFSVAFDTFYLIDKKSFSLRTYVCIMRNGLHEIGVVHIKLVGLAYDAIASRFLIDGIEQTSQFQVMNILHQGWA